MMLLCNRVTPTTLVCQGSWCSLWNGSTPKYQTSFNSLTLQAKPLRPGGGKGLCYSHSGACHQG